MLRRQFLRRREGFGPQCRGDDDAGDPVVRDELRQVAHSPQHHVPVNPLEMQGRLIVNQSDNQPGGQSCWSCESRVP